jgi:hypothetical protein
MDRFLEGLRLQQLTIQILRSLCFTAQLSHLTNGGQVVVSMIYFAFVICEILLAQ